MSLQEGLPEAAECQITLQNLTKNIFNIFVKQNLFQNQQDSAVKTTRQEGLLEAAECQITLQILKKSFFAIETKNTLFSKLTRTRCSRDQ